MAAADDESTRHRPHPSMSSRQTLFSATMSSLANLLLFLLGCWSFFRAFVLSNREVEVETSVEARQLRLGFAVVLVSQALSCALLLIPTWQQVCKNNASREHNTLALHASRAAGVALSLTGLGLLLISLPDMMEPNLVVGAILLALASGSLMITFWPARLAHAPAPRSTTASRPRDGASDDLRSPLLTSREIGDTHDHHAPNRYDPETDRPDEEAATAYRLMMVTAGRNNAQPPEDERTRTSGARRLFQVATPELLYLYAGFAVLMVRLPFSLSIPHFVSTTLSALANADFHRARHEIRFLFMLGTIDAALDFWCFFLFGYANIRIVRGLRLDLFARLLRQEVAFFDSTPSGELASRLNSDCSEMAQDLTWFFRMSLESVVRIVGIVSYMLIRSPILGSYTLLIVPIVGIINKYYGDFLNKNATQVQDALAQANAVAQEALANVRTVIAFAAERRECRRYENRIERQFQLNLKQLFMTGM